MKKIVTIFLTLLLLVNCSEDSPTNQEQIQKQFPSIENLTVKKFRIGEIVNLKGKFIPSETYKIFINDTECEIIETQSNFLKFKIPNQTKSGTIKLNYNNETKSIGEITVTDPVIGTWSLFLNQDGSQANDCEQKSILEVFSNGKYSRAIFYNETYTDQNGQIQTKCNGSEDSRESGTWSKSGESYVLKEDNDEEGMNAEITFSENFSIMKIDKIENSATWKRKE